MQTRVLNAKHHIQRDLSPSRVLQMTTTLLCEAKGLPHGPAQ